MKIKKGFDIPIDDFWYDLTNDYISYKEFLADEKDVKRVGEAVSVLLELEEAIEDYLEE